MTAATPAQAEVLERLSGRRREWQPDLRDELRQRLTEGLAGAAEGRADELWVSKHALSGVHGCERRHVEGGDFEWSVATAVGTVAHKAIELSIAQRGELVPVELVEDGVALLASDGRHGANGFLRSLPRPERAELTARAISLVGRFVEGFPRLDPRWRPAVETRRRAPLVDGQIVLSAAFDLTLGVADGLIARRVIVDVKTGRPWASDRDDLRYYALVETLVNGTPPARVASFYLDSGLVDVEDVDEGVLESAVRRVIAGVRRLCALDAGAAPVERAGPACTWCSLVERCETGRSHLVDDGSRAGR